MKMLRVVLAALVTGAVLAGPAVALAAEDEAAAPYLSIRGVDATASDVVRLTVAYDGDAEALQDATITDNGSEREIVGDVVSLAAAGEERAVVIAVDTSEAVDPVMADIRDAVSAVVAGLPSGTPIAIVTFADVYIQNRDLTTDVARLEEAIADLQANGESVLWNGLAGAGGMLESEAAGAQPTVVLVTASASVTSTATAGDAVGALRNAGAPLYVVGLEGARFDHGAIAEVVDRTGGLMLTSSDSEEIDELGAEVASTIDSQYIVAYERPTGDGAGNVADVSIRTADASTEATFVRGARTVKPADLFPQPPSSTGDGFLQSDMAKYGGVGLILLATALCAFSLILLTQQDDSHLTSVLQPYAEGFVEDSFDEAEESGMAKTALIQRAVEMTEDFADRKGFLVKTEAKLERADLPLRAAEALFFYAAMVAVAALLALVLTRSFMGTIIITVMAALLPAAWVNFKAKRRLKKFNRQLPDMLSLLSGTLRAGYSLMQGVEAVAREVEDPIGYELRRVVTESRLGRPLDEALEAAADRMGSADFAWAVMAIGIQREVGGNLAELLMTVADTMTARERLRREIDALTAEGKVSAMVLALLPVGLAGAMYVINPEYIGVLVSEKIGNIMLMGGLMLAGFGFWWMKKIIAIDV